MRTFIAIELDDSLAAFVADTQTMLQRTLSPASNRLVRWTHPEKAHLTLRFLGETDEDARRQIAAEVARVAADHNALRLGLNKLGCFPKPQQPSVLWLGFTGDLAVLQALQSAVETVARDAGFAAEKRAFKPHLTIGRVQRNAASASRRRLGEEFARIASMQEVVSPPVQVDELVYMRSDLQPTGAVYTPLARFSLGSGDRA